MDIEKITSSKINISVEYYDDKQKLLLNDTSRYDKVFIDNMNEIVSKGIVITGAEFLINSLFFKKSTKPKKYTKRDDLINAIDCSVQYFIDDLEITNNSLRVQENSRPESAILMKRVGESIGISVISRIIGANEADWSVIPELNIKAFDFKYAITAKGVVQIEAKGSSSDDVSSKNDNIYKHASNIGEKKKVMYSDSNHPYVGDFNYGTIAHCPQGREQKLKCYLLDPPSGSSNINLQEEKLSKRLGFYYKVMNFLSPESKLLDLLRDRIIDFSKNRVNITTADKLPYYIKNNEDGNFDKSFFLHKRTIELGGNKISGDWFFLKKNYILFIGMKNSIINEIVSQDVDSLLSLKYGILSKDKEVTFNIVTKYQKQQFKKLKIENEHIGESTFFKSKGNITLLESGIAIGILKLIR